MSLPEMLKAVENVYQKMFGELLKLLAEHVDNFLEWAEANGGLVRFKSKETPNAK